MERKKFPVLVRRTIQSLPLFGVLAAVILPALQKISQQLLVLVVILWVQVFFIVEVFLTGR